MSGEESGKFAGILTGQREFNESRGEKVLMKPPGRRASGGSYAREGALNKKMIVKLGLHWLTPSHVSDELQGSPLDNGAHV